MNQNTSAPTAITPKTAGEVSDMIRRLQKSAAEIPSDPNMTQSAAAIPVQADGADASKGLRPTAPRPTNNDGAAPKVDVGNIDTGTAAELAPAASPAPETTEIVKSSNAMDRFKAIMNRIGSAVDLTKTAGAPAAPGETPAAAAPVAKSPEGAGVKTAGVNTAEAMQSLAKDSDLPSFLMKVGAAILGHEQGRQLFEAITQDAVGVEQARELMTQTDTLMKYARAEEEAREGLVKQALAVQQEEASLLAQTLQQLHDTQPEAYARVIKTASDLSLTMVKVANAAAQLPEVSGSSAEDQADAAAFYQSMVKEGAADAAMMMEAGAGDPNAPMPEIPGATGEMSPEELMQLLDQAVAQGIIPEEQAAQLREALMSGAAGQQEEMMAKQASALDSEIDALIEGAV